MSKSTKSHREFKQIVIDNENYESLKSLGFAGQSFNDVIKSLLDSKKKSTRYSESEEKYASSSLKKLTCDQIIRELIEIKNRARLLEEKAGHPHSSKSSDQ